MQHPIRSHRPPADGPVVAWLDRLIGDALVGAILVLGFVFCLGAARAADGPAAAEVSAAMIHAAVSSPTGATALR